MKAKRPAEIEHDHVTWEEVEHVLRTTDLPRERKPLFHALALCPECRAATAPLFELFGQRLVSLATSFGEVEIAVEEHEAPELWSRIESDTLQGAQATDDVLSRLRGDARWPSWGLVAWHARRSEEAARDDPAEALHWARLATSGAPKLKADQPAAEEWNAELRAFAHAALGNAHRVAGDLVEAQEAFRRAREHLEAYEETADYLPFRPRVYDLESSLHRARRNFKAAFELLDRAYEAWDVVDRVRPEDRARVLLKKAKLLDEIDDLEGALAMHEEAAALLGPEADDAFRLVVDNNLLFYLLRAGRVEEAADRLPALKDLAEAVGGELDKLRVQWVEAHVYERSEDDPDMAETLLRKVLDGFCERHVGYDAALVALDLAHLLLRRGVPDEVQEVALATKAIFETLGVEVEVHRAVRTFLAAHRQDEHAVLGVSLVTRVWWEARERR